MEAEETLLTLIKEEETHWLNRARSPLHYKAMNTPIGYKFVGVHYGMCMEFTCKLASSLAAEA
eukprot:269445-Pelagomonas_calceolata.AAC.1